MNKEEIRQAPENEQRLLNGLIEDIEDRLFTPELQDIKREYLMGGEEMEESARKLDRPLIIIPEKHYAEAQSRLDAIRERNERSQLEYDCEKLKEGLINDFGVISERTELIPGKRYGRIRFSPMATAVRKGECIPNHGEIYIDIWRYCEDGVFRTENAWGAVYENHLPGCPMIEIE